MRGDISPLTPERDIEQHSEKYSVSAYGHPFAPTGQLPTRGPSGFMPPPPAERSSGYGALIPSDRSTTPQIQGIDICFSSIRNSWPQG